MSWSQGGGWASGSLGTVLGGAAAASAGPVITLSPPTGAMPVTTISAPATGPLVALDPLRQTAHAAYARGALDEALVLQQRLVDAAIAAGQVTPEDFLFLGLIHYAHADLAAGAAILRTGLQRFPDHAAIHENLAVFLLGQGKAAETIEACAHAVRLGSDSPNVHDCLADAYNQIGRLEEAVRAGQHALMAKDRKFGSRAPLVAVPDKLPPPFNPLNPDENVIAYCLWGNNPRYHVPLLESVRIRPHLFPAWSIRVYHDNTVDPSFLSTLAAQGADLRPMALPSGVPAHRRLLWRFEVASDPTVRRFLCRDADSLLSVKERVAIDAWLNSSFWFHAMRDWYTHTDLLLAGMWGGVGNVLPPVPTLMTAYTAWRLENDHVDQDVLAEAVWPTIQHNVLIHDSIFSPCLGSVPFPPYGHAPAGTHIGQNAFLHFTRTG